MATFDALTTAAVRDEFEEKLLGGRVQQVLHPDPMSLGLEIYAHRRRWPLLLSADGRSARACLIPERLRRGTEKPTPLLLLLRKYVDGAVLVDVQQPPYERILQLVFEHPEHGRNVLVAEIMGRWSNLILLDDMGDIRDALKRIGPEETQVRRILPGEPYRPPPPMQGIAPDRVTAEDLASVLSERDPEEPLWRALVSILMATSPQAAREVVARAVGDASALVADADPAALASHLRQLWAAAEAGQWEPSVAMDGEQPVAYAPYRLTHLGDVKQMPSISQAIAAYYAAKGQADPYRSLRDVVRGEIAQAQARLRRQMEALERERDEHEDPDRLRQFGEWILTFSSQIAPGQSELVVDLGEEGVLTIPLDPQSSPAENAQRYFARYRKAQRAAEEIPARLEHIRHEMAYLEQLLLELDLARSQPEIAAVREALAEAGYLARRPGRSAPPPGPIREVMPDGTIILVGRNSRQNDEITFRVAGPDDLWLHARGVPGAHVIIRSHGRPVADEVLQRAAELAAYYSAAREDPEVVVSVVPRRRVRRLRGGRPGQVTFTGERTLRVRPRP